MIDESRVALLAATDTEIVLCSRADGDWRPVARFAIPAQVTCVAAVPGRVLVGTTDGIVRMDTPGGGMERVPLDVPHVRWIAFHPEDGALAFAGTEPAAILRSGDGGRTWRECAEVARLRDEHGWYLPYSPRAGCVRSFAFHGRRGYAAVEVGGVVRSDDGGETWRLAAGSTEPPHIGAVPPEGPAVHPDVHSVAVDPSSPDLVFAATNGGLFRSEDRGASWKRISGDVYTRALWLDPADATHIVHGAATRAGWNGGIEESTDGGTTWGKGRGMEMPWHRDPVERLEAIGGELFAVTEEGRILACPLGGGAWRRVLEDVPGVVTVAAWEGR
ncbi:MAG TPA: sialidase family protein [Longimicrobium sp.]|nr:sialidase family protein [Longimicrobium sp.]